MALSLANMLTRVKRIVPSTTLDTELQDSILERMNYLASLDIFPFQEKYESATLTSATYVMTTPNNFATAKSVTLWMGDDDERDIEILDAKTFSQMFPKPDERTASTPTFCCIRVAEGEIWFDCPADGNQTIRLEYYAIPDDATDTTVSQLTELAKLALIKWSAADGLRMMQEHDRADQFEREGNDMLGAIKRRYQLAKEEGARFISMKEAYWLGRKKWGTV